MSNVSVVIPTYNGARFIREALESVFAQTLPPREIIVVDDASTDGTPELVEVKAKTAPFDVRCIRLAKNSGGPAWPMNRGISEAQGEFIVLLDHDDMMSPTKIESHRPAFEVASVGLVFGPGAAMSGGVVRPPRPECFSKIVYAIETTFEDIGGIVPSPTAFDLLVNDGYNYGGAGGTSIRRSVWEQLGHFDASLRIAWDYDFAVRLALAGWDVAFCQSTSYIHRKHDGNLEFVEEGLQLSREIVRVFEKQVNSPLARSAQLRTLQDRYQSAHYELVWKLRQKRRITESLRLLAKELDSKRDIVTLGY